MNKTYPVLAENIAAIRQLPIAEDRKPVLQQLIDYIQQKVDQGLPVNLNFICTHNSRRSQFSQIWAQTAADLLGIKVQSYSGGVEVTAFNERAVASITRFGFEIAKEGNENPQYRIFHSAENKAIISFSKLFNDAKNPTSNFAAVMTCSDADENCPFIPGAEARIPLRYEDPKAFDNTAQEAEKYDERSRQIAAELFYVFSQIENN